MDGRKQEVQHNTRKWSGQISQNKQKRGGYGYRNKQVTPDCLVNGNEYHELSKGYTVPGCTGWVMKRKEGGGER